MIQTLRIGPDHDLLALQVLRDKLVKLMLTNTFVKFSVGHTGREKLYGSKHCGYFEIEIIDYAKFTIPVKSDMRTLDDMADEILLCLKEYRRH